VLDQPPCPVPDFASFDPACLSLEPSVPLFPCASSSAATPAPTNV
jgi:hypothetical protein